MRLLQVTVSVLFAGLGNIVTSTSAGRPLMPSTGQVITVIACVLVQPVMVV